MQLGPYYLNFHYEKQENSIGRETDVVGVSVMPVHADKDEKPIYEDSITRFHKDPFDKEVARKILIKRFFKAEGISKEDRRTYWEQYNASKPGGRWSTPQENQETVSSS